MIKFTTKNKIALAKIARILVMIYRRAFGLGENALVKRNGILWDLDLREGIDFSIFFLGGFEIGTLRSYKKFIKSGDTVLDIGANIGAHTLPFAQLVGPSGRVEAFEPTLYAFKKLQKNVSLNKELAYRININRKALLENKKSKLPKRIYSSWPLVKKTKLNKTHQGALKLTSGAKTTTLDSEVTLKKLKRVDFIKLDVDGYEDKVLLGATRTIKKFKPKIIMEWAPYLLNKNKKSIKILNILKNSGYKCNIHEKKLINHKSFKKMKASKNILFY